MDTSVLYEMVCLAVFLDFSHCFQGPTNLCNVSKSQAKGYVFCYRGL